MKKSLLATAAVVMLAVPASAFALTTSPAKPQTISLSSAGGVANCTRLPYATTAKLDVLAQITISLNGTKVRSLRAANVAAGSHTIRWCGHDPAGANVAPGTYTWHVQTKHLKGDPLGTATADRTLTVVA